MRDCDYNNTYVIYDGASVIVLAERLGLQRIVVRQIPSSTFRRLAAAFAEAERDRIRERIGQVKADQKARGRYLGGKVPFGFHRDRLERKLEDGATSFAGQDRVRVGRQTTPSGVAANSLRLARHLGLLVR